MSIGIRMFHFVKKHADRQVMQKDLVCNVAEESHLVDKRNVGHIVHGVARD